jgi:hypothetical protein
MPVIRFVSRTLSPVARSSRYMLAMPVRSEVKTIGAAVRGPLGRDVLPHLTGRDRHLTGLHVHDRDLERAEDEHLLVRSIPLVVANAMRPPSCDQDGSSTA